MASDTRQSRETGGGAPDLSLVLPCYNEASCLGLTVPRLAAAFAAAGVSLEIVLVDNGSTDDTSAAIDRLIARGLPVVKAIVPINQGQGFGILTGQAAASGRYIGHLGADGQVEPAEVLAVYRALRDAPGPALAKGRRRARQDGPLRCVISRSYNALMWLLFSGIASRDINCNPKMLPREVLGWMDLRSRDWFLEAELMLKASYLGLPIIEVDIQDLPRTAGRSHVRLATVLEFIRNIVIYRMGAPWRAWRKGIPALQRGNAVWPAAPARPERPDPR